MGILGQALADRYEGKQTQPLWVHCDRAEDEVMDTSLFFSRFQQFHRVEQIALNRCGKSVLDLGAGAGRHSLELEKRGAECLSVEADPLLVALMEARGVKNPLCSSWQEAKLENKYDTVLVLMNGAGLCGRKTDFPSFISKLKSFLSPEGKILLDSSSVSYLPAPKEGIEKDEVVFSFSYCGKSDAPFFWYFGEQNDILNEIQAQGLTGKMVFKHHDGRFLIEACMQD